MHKRVKRRKGKTKKPGIGRSLPETMKVEARRLRKMEPPELQKELKKQMDAMSRASKEGGGGDGSYFRASLIRKILRERQ
jgi:hypothetical protein